MRSLSCAIALRGSLIEAKANRASADSFAMNIAAATP